MQQILPFLAIAGLALSPGPNNTIVMHAGAQGGARDAAPAIAVIVAAGAAMVLVTSSLVDTIVSPAISRWTAIAGGLLLAGLGLSMMRRRSDAGEGARPTLDLASLAAFQFLNPKGWLLAASASALALASGMHTVLIALAFAAICASCLLVWAVAGQALRRFMNVRSRAETFRTIVGLATVAMGVSMAIGAALKGATT